MIKISEDTTYLLSFQKEELRRLWWICNDYLITRMNIKPDQKDSMYFIAEEFCHDFRYLVDKLEK